MDRRSEGRKRTAETIRLAVGGRKLTCTVKNLSTNGCLIDCPGLEAQIGDPVHLTLEPATAITGEIAWQVANSTGIFFHRPVAREVVDHYALDDWPLRENRPIARTKPPIARTKPKRPED